MEILNWITTTHWLKLWI